MITFAHLFESSMLPMAGYYTAHLLLNGTKIRRDYFLPDERSVIAQIQQDGGVPLSIRAKSGDHGWNREWFSSAYKRAFLRAINFHTKTGFSAENALFYVIEHEPNRKKRVEMEPALLVLKGGGSFSDALDQLRMFDRPVISILRAGEAGRFLKDAIRLCIEYLDAKKNTWARLFGALSAMAFDLSIAFSAPFLIHFYGIPMLKEQGVSSTDPKAVERFAEGIAKLSTYNGILMGVTVAIVLAFVLFIVMWLQKGKVREKMDVFAMKIPLLRSFLLDRAVADTFAIVGRMLEAKVPFLVACHTASEATIIPSVKQFWADAEGKVHFGVASALTQSRILTGSEKHVIAAHQNSGQLSEVFMEISKERDASYKRGATRLVQLSIVFFVVYFAAIVLIALQVNVLQSEGMNISLKGLGGM